jgi:hypothetical protein
MAVLMGGRHVKVPKSSAVATGTRHDDLIMHFDANGVIVQCDFAPIAAQLWKG